MIKTTFYVERKPCAPVHFEELLSRRFSGWTRHNTIGVWQSECEDSQTYVVIFDDYPEFRIDLRYLTNILKRELSQKSVLVTIETVEVL